MGAENLDLSDFPSNRRRKIRKNFQKVDLEYHEELLELVKMTDRHISSICATAYWVTEPVTQDDAARKFKTTDNAIRECRELVSYALDIDLEKARQETGSGVERTKQDIIGSVIEKLKDRKEFREGYEYNKNGRNYSVLKNGWLKLEEFIDE